MIYRLNFDTKNYAGVFVNEDELDEKVGDLLYHEGFPIQEEWADTPIGELYDATGKERDSLPIPDIASWVGNLALSPKAYSLLADSLRAYGEFLPISINDEIWQVLNLTRTLGHQVIDESQSEQALSGGIYMGLKALAFRDEALVDQLLFRCKYDQGVGQFATSVFKALLEKHELTGVIFSKDLVK